MGEVVRLEIPKRHRQIVSPKEMRSQGSCPEPMVWDMCRYTRRSKNEDEPCRECPAWEDDPDHGRVKRGCFGIAEEACRYALAWHERIVRGGPME